MDLFNFLIWASGIPVPDYNDSQVQHNTYSFFFAELLNDPENILVWKRFFLHLNKYKDFGINAWLLCVCGLVLRHKFSAPNSSLLGALFIDLIEREDKMLLPEGIIDHHQIHCRYR